MILEKILPVGSKRREVLRKIYYKYISKYTEEEKIYRKWINENEPNAEILEEQRNAKFELNPKISIVVPVYNTPEKFFEELVESLQKQTYSNWELCLADGSPTPIEYMKEYPKKDERIKYKIIGENKGISGNTNEALTLVTGDYIGLLDHDDLLPVFSLYEVVKAINENPNVEFLYSDEDKLESKSGPRYGVFFKPDFSPYTLNSANYICHFSIFKKELMDKLGGFRGEYDGSQDFDIVSRASELTNNIVHIPKVLYHWRAHRNSTAQNSDSKPYAFEVGKKVIKDHIKRYLDTDVEVEDGLTPGSYEVKYKVKGNPKVSIIVDMRNGNFDISRFDDLTYSNYEIIVIKESELGPYPTVKPSDNNFDDYNRAIKKSTGDYFIIIDDSFLEYTNNSWIEDLLGICQDNTVGIVGTKLYNPENKVEHCGIILGMNGAGDLLYKGAQKDIGTYMQRLSIIHNVSSVYTKYALIKKDIYEEVRGFDYEFKGLVNCIDFCLKVLKAKKQIVLNPNVSFKVKKLNDGQKDIKEENSLINKWPAEYKKGDIYFSPNLSKKETGIRILTK